MHSPVSNLQSMPSDPRVGRRGTFLRAGRTVFRGYGLVISVGGLLLTQGSKLSAATRTWADVGTDFATAANWGGTAPTNNITSDIGSFNSVLTNMPVLAANRSINGLAFTNLATGAITLSGAGTLTTGTGGINNASTSGLKTVSTSLVLGANQLFTNNGAMTIAGATLTNGGFLLTLTGTGDSGSVSSNISGTGGLTKTGTGTWVVSGNNSYSGATNVSAGVLNLQSDNALGNAGTGTTVANNAQLQLQNNITVTGEPLTIRGTGVGGTGALLNISGNNTWTGAITLSNTATFSSDAGLLTLSGTISGTNRTLTVGGAGDTFFSNTVALGNGALIKNNAGTLTLSGTNTYTGATTINAGTVSVNTLANTSSASALGAPTTAANGTIAIGSTTNDATLQYTGSGSTTNRVINLAGTTGGAILDASGTGALVFTSNFTATGAGSKTLSLIGSSTAANTISGAIVNNNAARTTSVLKDGTGTWVLSGNNTYTGTTTVNGGTLRATSFATALGGGTLTLNGGTLSLANDAGLNFGRNTTVTGDSTVESDVLTFGNAGVTHTLGTLTIGAQQLSITMGANVGSGTAGITFGATTLTGNASFDRAGGTNLTLGALNDSGSARTVTFQGSGTTTLGTAATSLVNGTTINLTGGTLNSDNATALGSLANVTLSNSAVLTLGATGQTVGALNGASTNTVNLGANTLTVGSATNNLSSNFAGTLTGSSTQLTKAGTGTFQLSGSNTYTGATLVNAGTLAIQSAGALGTAANTANTTVASGATLQMANNITTTNAGTLVLNGTGASGTGALQNLSGNNRWNSDMMLGSNATIYSATAGNTLYMGNAAYGTSLFAMGSNTLTIDGPGDVWFDANVGVSGDTGGFIKNGTGKVTFYGYNTFFTGATFVNAGTLDLIVGPLTAGIYGLNGALTIGTGSGSAGAAVVNVGYMTYAGQISPSSAVTINSDGLLNAGSNGGVGAGSLTFNGGQVAITGGTVFSPTGSITANANSAHQTALITGGTLALGGATTFTVNHDAALTSDLTVGAAISGGSIVKQGAGVLTLSGTNTINGATLNAGTLNAQANDALGTAGTVTVASGATLQVQGGVSLGQASTILNGTGTAGNGAIQNISGNNTFTGPVTVASASRIQSDAGTLTLAGNIALGTNSLTVGGAASTALNGAISGSGSLTKAGAGTLTLSGNNAAYTGAVNVNAGTLVAQASTVFNSANAITVGASGTLNLNDYNIAVASINNSGTVNLGAGTSDTLTLSSGTSFLQAGGAFTGAGTIIINAGATLTLNAAFNNSGINFILNGGTLNLNNTGGALDNAIGSLTINANSILDFGSSVATSLTANSVAFGNTSLVLTVNNWVNAVDYFLSSADPGGSQGNPPLTQFNFTGGGYSTSDNKWLPYDHQITPAPEPAVYGAVLAGCSTLLLAWRRRRAARMA